MSKTFQFKELIPNFTTFKDFYNQELGIDIESATAEDQAIYEHCFKILYNRYCLSNVRYSTKEAFYCEFMIVLDDSVKQYMKRYKLIQKAYALTDAELIELNRAIQNYANNPNTTPTNPLDPLEYISSQTFQVNVSNKLQAYLLAIETLPSQYDDDFLNKFKYLFIQIFNKDIPLYLDDEEEEV